MIRIDRVSRIVATAIAGLGMTAAHAGGTGYGAVLQAPTAQARIVAHGLLWRCAAERCAAAASNSRPAIVCEALARTVGTVVSFTHESATFGPEQLARCNADVEMRRSIAAK